MRTSRTALAIVLALGTTGAALAKKVTFTLPPDTSTLAKTSDPGYQNTDNLCATCHSRDYITIQPRGKGKDFWTAEVTKMVKVYGAPIAEENWPAIIEYLTANY